MPTRQPGPMPGGGQAPPGENRSQQLLDAVNALAYGVTSLAESLPQLCETLEVISQQFAVLIAAEAQRRNLSADQFVQGVLQNLGSRIFNGRRGG